MNQKMLLIVGHPNFTNASVTKEIFGLLNKTNFNQILILEQEYDAKNNQFNLATSLQALENHQHIIFFYPLWWYSMPWNMKLWMDTVVSAFFDKHNKTKKQFSFIVTCGQKNPLYETPELNCLLKHLITSFQFLGWEFNDIFALYNARKTTSEERAIFTDKVNQALLNH